MVFKQVLKKGIIKEYEEYSYQPRVEILGSIKKMEKELLQIIKQFKPDLIHWNQLNNNYCLTKRLLIAPLSLMHCKMYIPLGNSETSI